MNDDNIFFNFLTEKLDEYKLDDMMRKLNIKLINHKERQNNESIHFNELNLPIKSILKELLEKCDKQSEK